MALKEELTQKLGGKTLQEAENTEIYQALLQLTKERLQAVPAITGDRKLYYVSAEFLIGKLLSNNLINLGMYDEVLSLIHI